MPPISTFFKIVDTLGDALAPSHQPLSADELITLAHHRSGLTDFGQTPFQAAFRKFLRACFEDANLSLVGRMATRWDVVRFLSNLLRLAEEEKRAPDILAQPIARPIFISGLPRSGTTFLHSLLAEDPGNLVPRVWQLIQPYPPRNSGSGPDRRARRVGRQLRLFGFLAPDFRRMHPIDADSPQECSEITAHVFASLRFDTTYRIPSYRRWLDEAGHLEAYRFHKRFLQHLQHQTADGGRWVLKCPDHVFALDAIRAVYPDARLVFVHRDPLAVLLSVARLTETLRRPFTRSIDKAEIGRQDSDRWLAATELMIAAAQEQLFEEPIFHVQYLDLVRDPVGTVAALYAHFGETLRPDAAARIGRLVEAKPNGGYRAHGSRLEEYGLDAALERERYARYMAHFGIQPEPQRRSGPQRGSASPILASRRSAKPVK
jgi:hypothetical protein